MKTILRIPTLVHLRSSDPRDVTRFRHDATHVHFYFAEYQVLEGGIWQEGRSWVSTVSVEELFNMLDEAGLLKEVTASKQSGGK